MDEHPRYYDECAPHPAEDEAGQVEYCLGEIEAECRSLRRLVGEGDPSYVDADTLNALLGDLENAISDWRTALDG